MMNINVMTDEEINFPSKEEFGSLKRKRQALGKKRSLHAVKRWRYSNFRRTMKKINNRTIRHLFLITEDEDGKDDVFFGRGKSNIYRKAMPSWGALL